MLQTDVFNDVIKLLVKLGNSVLAHVHVETKTYNALSTAPKRAKN